MNRRQKLVQEQYLNNEERVIKRLNLVYNQSLTMVNDKIKNLQFSIDKLQQTYDWMDDNDPKKAQIKSQIQSKIYQKQYQEQLQKQLDGILDKMKTEQYLNVSDYLEGCYEDGFVGTMFDMHGQGVPLMLPLDQESMVRAVQLESKISEGLYTRLGEDVDELKKKITAQVSRSIATGMSYAQTAKQLANYTRIGYNNAVRIARTEGHRIQTTAAMDACHKAKERGADVLKQWDSTLDDVTRESHRQVDGEIRELDEAFSNGLDFPGDPAGSAAEVINCRCALLQRARWALDDGFTKANSFTKQLETFDSPADYDGFKKAFFSKENKRYMKYVEQMEEKYGTKNFEKVLGKMTPLEYKHYSDLLTENPLFNKAAKVTKAEETKATKTLEKQPEEVIPPKQAEPEKPKQAEEVAVPKAEENKPKQKAMKKAEKPKPAEKIYTAKELDEMSLPQLKKIALKLTTEYYESGKSGISFGTIPPRAAAAALVEKGSKTSLKKDILSIQKRMKKGK